MQLGIMHVFQINDLWNYICKTDEIWKTQLFHLTGNAMIEI